MTKKTETGTWGAILNFLFNIEEGRKIAESRLRLNFYMASVSSKVGMTLITVTGINEFLVLFKRFDFQLTLVDGLIFIAMVLLVAASVGAIILFSMTYHMFSYAKELEREVKKAENNGENRFYFSRLKTRWFVVLATMLGLLFEGVVNALAFTAKTPVAADAAWLERFLHENVGYIYAVLIFMFSSSSLTLSMWLTEISDSIRNSLKALESHKQHVSGKPAKLPPPSATDQLEEPETRNNGKSEIMRNDYAAILQRLLNEKMFEFNNASLAEVCGWSAATASRALKDPNTGLVALGIVTVLPEDPRIFSINAENDFVKSLVAERTAA